MSRFSWANDGANRCTIIDMNTGTAIACTDNAGNAKILIDELSSPVCTFDNPKTMYRECWQDGKLLVKYPNDLISRIDKIPAHFYFFGANIGGWRPGNVCGDIEAIGKSSRPQCRFHDFDAEACEKYSGEIPCEIEPH